MIVYGTESTGELIKNLYLLEDIMKVYEKHGLCLMSEDPYCGLCVQKYDHERQDYLGSSKIEILNSILKKESTPKEIPSPNVAFYSPSMQEIKNREIAAYKTLYPGHTFEEAVKKIDEKWEKWRMSQGHEEKE